MNSTDVYELSNQIEAESVKLNALVCNKGYNFEPLKTDLARTLSMVKRCIADIEMQELRLIWAQKDSK